MLDTIEMWAATLFLVLPIIIMICVVFMVITDFKETSNVYLNKKNYNFYQVYKLDDSVRIVDSDFSHVGFNISDYSDIKYLTPDKIKKNFKKVKGMKK